MPTRPKLPPFVGSFLRGKTVDESGDIRDDKTGQLLARAGGDLPSIVGRKVSNSQGDILGDDGELLGKRREEELEREREKERMERGEGKGAEEEKGGEDPVPQQPEQEKKQERPPRRTEEERRENAQAWRKENPGESPSDIFLDVKSTTEGIQLTIRIPTVFGGQQVRPNISFS
ncbi:hypothetical protein B0T16DRAFT_515751 [Cercophora newfieldiana]|uniref:Uncharacterized protein n=1 Tax=Cercophora newfieldiana TaxID=92897 RepID=A0AA40CL60_9PEZI|nr:hypothetical protein B0T16DRAFT_515751 [Cercophora newfieldiana]